MQIRKPPLPHSRYYSGIAPHGLAAVNRIIYRLEPVILAPSRATATSFLGRSVIQVPVGPPYVISRFALFGHRLRLFPGLSLLLFYFTSAFFLLGLLSGFLPSWSSIRLSSYTIPLPLGIFAFISSAIGSIDLFRLAPPETLSSATVTGV
ncbi:uncharacterized protein AKAW2_80873S [Aspergillus luchuensis]|uniref:Uncharacterized protein n=1 Tax=Aspergillus kawachii TaxID=1069201 RepID=A0A7R7WLA8_ASPKA|nr:uncharacterized protein AKAW2_80873S [Aspergillus luchuensis]BCS05072.1 hypothetical protein AKAW2_80873S [Aspergillus luchuensis]